ncbi:hypothetical protein [Frankia sp. AgB32]|uniref:hypothetical protein n=1 Tax=Frankia sp. AgB32 TaxID=631119 RepID=UPI0020102E67|nr:hypothetical protein [Frankia sp. AgB32]MCK9896824.1 hypothetical protein [Frankia sp. AgB32]
MTSSQPRWSRASALRRVLTVAGLALFAVPVFAATASASEIGTRYNPDPLTALQTWGIYGGAIVGGFLVATLLAAWSSRSSGPVRYRPGQPWEHDEVWIGTRPEEIDGEREQKAVPGAGGASGNW